MRKIIKILIVLIVLLLSGCVSEDEINYNFKVISTNYSETRTFIHDYLDGEFKVESLFEIKGVEFYSIFDNLYLFSSYDGKVVNTTTSEIYTILHGGYDMIRYENDNIMIHSTGLNKYQLTRYDKSFQVNGSSDTFSGNPRKMILHEDKLYLLNNRFSEDDTIEVFITIVDPKSLSIVEEFEVDKMIFGFHLEIIDDILYILGHNKWYNEHLYIYEVSLNTLETREYEIDEDVFWISDFVLINDKKYLVNDYSIFTLNELYEIDLVYKNSLTIIDTYFYSDELIYILQGDYELMKFEVVIINMDFEIIETYPIEVEDTRPTRLIVE